jgi:thymidylate synthase (FAD)
MKVNCLDKGSVELITNTCKGDLLVVNAARCSFDKQHEIFDNTNDAKLIHYLAKHEHLLPFRHPSATLRIHAPIFVLRQLGKHQVGFSWSEVSRRYIDSDPDFYYPMPSEWRGRASDIKQGSTNEGLSNKNSIEVDDLVDTFYCEAFATYQTMLEAGVCPEQARMILPQSMHTTTVTTGTLLGWFHLYKLRTEEHTQLETQEYATAVGQIMSELFPVSWEALCEYAKDI